MSGAQRAHRVHPLFRSGHLLVANSVLTAAIGVGYWLLAAHLYAPAVVGVNSAAISAMMFLAGVAQLNLMSALLRFVPTAGAAARRMITTAYVLGATLSGLAAVTFLAGLRSWAPELAGLLRSAPAAAGFVSATMLWSIFVMQDNALVALDRAAAVPVENGAFAVLKMVLLAGGAAALPVSGILLSWTAAMTVAVAATTVYVFIRAVPAFAVTRPGSARAPSLRMMSRYVLPDYVGSLAWIACTSLVPVLVLDLTDSAHAAAFALAWSICLALYGIPVAFGQSLVAHGVHEPGRLDEHHRKAVRHMLRLVAPLVVVVLVGAQLTLGIFGRWYAEQGATTLRLLAVSALPNVVVGLAISRARVARRMRFLVITLAGLCVLVLALTVLLVPRIGIAGAGVAWLAGQSVVAAALLGLAPARRLWARTVRMRMVRSRRGGVPDAMLRQALQDAAADGWAVESAVSTVSDTAVLMVRHPGRTGVLKVSASASGVATLDRERHVLASLCEDERLGPWRELLPAVLGGDGCSLLVRRLPGHDGRRLARTDPAGLTTAALAAIEPLHRLDQTRTSIGRYDLRRWIDEPIALVRNAVPHPALDQLAGELRDELAGRAVTLGWVHGDFYPGNVLVCGDSNVCGIVDWSQARAADLSVLDRVHWLLTTPATKPIGCDVAGRLGSGRYWRLAEWRHLNDCELPGRTLLLLGWLRHVAGNLAKSSRYAASPVWARRNVVPVLREVGR